MDTSDAYTLDFRLVERYTHYTLTVVAKCDYCIPVLETLGLILVFVLSVSCWSFIWFVLCVCMCLLTLAIMIIRT